MRILPVNLGQNNNKHQTNALPFKSREERELFEYIVENGIKEKMPVKTIFKELQENFKVLVDGFSSHDENNFVNSRPLDSLRISTKDNFIACSNSLVKNGGRKRHYIEYSIENGKISKSIRSEYPSKEHNGKRFYNKDVYTFDEKQGGFVYDNELSEQNVAVPSKDKSIINQFKAKFYS